MPSVISWWSRMSWLGTTVYVPDSVQPGGMTSDPAWGGVGCCQNLLTDSSSLSDF